MWRFLWAFFGNDYARWNAILPYGRGYWRKLRAYGNAFFSGQPQEYVGHNPAARLAIAVLLLLLLLQAATGLILAGTDLFWPPFGRWFAEWVAAAGVDPAMVSSLSTNTLDRAAYKAMRGFRTPIVTIHTYAFYVLAGTILMHLIAVIVLRFVRVEASRRRCSLAESFSIDRRRIRKGEQTLERHLVI